LTPPSPTSPSSLTPAGPIPLKSSSTFRIRSRAPAEPYAAGTKRPNARWAKIASSFRPQRRRGATGHGTLDVRDHGVTPPCRKTVDPPICFARRPVTGDRSNMAVDQTGRHRRLPVASTDGGGASIIRRPLGCGPSPYPAVRPRSCRLPEIGFTSAPESISPMCGSILGGTVAWGSSGPACLFLFFNPSRGQGSRYLARPLRRITRIFHLLYK